MMYYQLNRYVHGEAVEYLYLQHKDKRLQPIRNRVRPSLNNLVI